jgi:hypothetical protein
MGVKTLAIPKVMRLKIIGRGTGLPVEYSHWQELAELPSICTPI